MPESGHKTQHIAAQTSLNAICHYLIENGHKIEGEIEINIDTIQRALTEYNNTIQVLGQVRGKIEYFFTGVKER